MLKALESNLANKTFTAEPCSPRQNSPTSSSAEARTTCSPSRAIGPTCWPTSTSTSKNVANPTSRNGPSFATDASNAAPSGPPRHSTSTSPSRTSAKPSSSNAPSPPKPPASKPSSTAYGITSHSPNTASAERLLALNRGHWTVEATHHILDCCWDEDRCRIRTGHGPENTTRLRRFAIGVIRSKSHCVAAAVRRLNRKPRLVFDYLKMTENTLHPTKLAPSSARTN